MFATDSGIHRLPLFCSYVATRSDEEAMTLLG